MNPVRPIRNKCWWFYPLVIMALIAACAREEQDPTAGVIDEPTGVVETEATSVIDETAILEATAVPTADLQGTPEAQPTLDAQATPVAQATAPGMEGQMMLMETSRLVGLPILGAAGEEIGEVDNLLIAPDGRLAFVTFDVGGFLGIGAHNVAVPWSDFSLSPEDEELRLPLTQAQLEGLTEFAEELTEDDAFLDSEEASGAGLDLGSDNQVGLIRMGGALTDFNLWGANGEDIGEIEEAILDVNQGQVQYAIAEVGGVLGLGERAIAVPWERLQINAERGDALGANFVLPGLTEQTLEEAPRYDNDNWNSWPDPAAENYDADLRSYWEGVAVGTDPGAGPTTEGPMLIQSSTLVGLPVTNTAGDTETEVSDLLVAPDGTIAYVLMDGSVFADASENWGQVAVPWSGLEPDAANERLMLSGDPGTLDGFTPLDPNANLGEGVIDANAAGLPAEFDGLIRMGGALQDFEILGANGEDIGEVEQGIVDLSNGRMSYAIADVGGFLGVAEHTIAVPWERLQVAPDQADETGATFQMNVTEETLENAPTWDASNWALWPNTATSDFDTETQSYWETAG